MMEKEPYAAPVCQVYLFAVEPVMVNSNSFGTDLIDASDQTLIPDYESETEAGSILY